MNNRDLEATWSYHDGSKHSPSSIYSDPHYLDFENQPLPFKIYSDLEPIPLPHDFSSSKVSALPAISANGIHHDGDCTPDKNTLASIFHHSAGITRRRAYPGGEMLFRAAACTGALYHIELYLVCGDLPDMEAGVYHFGVHDFALRKLREGDYRGVLVRASGDEPAIMDAPAIVVCTGTYWRNAWKYRARTYRHCFWDSGTILANLLAVSAAHGVPAKVVSGFVDESVNRLLDLDAQREVALSLIPLGCTSVSPAGPSPAATTLDLSTVSLSKTEVDYPAVRDMHEASSLISAEETAAWRGQTPLATMPEPTGRLFPLRPHGDEELDTGPIERVIVRRGSSRQFVHQSFTFSQLSTIVHRATRGIPTDFLDPPGTTLNDLYLVVHAVDDLPSGSYVFRREENALELLEEGSFRQAAGYLGLQQSLPADASVDVFFLTDLKLLLERYGNRGYRAAQLEAGIIGGKMYLAAYAQRLGATGLTFFDDDVTAFFSPHAEGKSAMFLVALGVPLRRRITRQ